MKKQDSGNPIPDVDKLISEIRRELVPSSKASVRPRLESVEIMRRVRKEVARRQGVTSSPDEIIPQLADSARQSGMPSVRWVSSAIPNVAQREFTLSELVAASDETFVTAAYRAVLRREPELEGFAHYLAMLRSGRISKVEILAELRWSDEGKARSVHIDGLLAPYLLQKWRRKPVVGRVISWVHSLLRLGAFSNRQQLFETSAAREAHGLGSVINRLSAQFQSKVEELESAQMHQEQSISAKHQALRAEIDDLHAQLGTREGQEAQLERDLRLSQLSMAVDKHVSETRSAIAAGQLAANQQLSSLHTDVSALNEARDTQLSQLASASDKHVGDTRSIVVLERATVEQRLSALQSQVDVLGVELVSIQDEVEPRLTLVQAELARAKELTEVQLDSQRSQLELLRPFPAGLVTVQNSLAGLMERHASTSAQLEKVAEFELRIEALNRQIQDRLDQMQVELETGRERLSRQSMEISVHGEELGAHRSELQGHGAVLSLMEQAKANELAGARALDPLYAALEDQFRGTRELVRARAEPYLELVRDAGMGAADSPVLDLGCGRGEWLELLRERGFVGRGVDSNRVFLELCRGRGLDVIEGDVIAVMRSLPEGSFGVITGMHIAEHLPFDVLINLLDEARRLLKPNGLLALETPNPENLEVASHFFYMDPTHRNPLPPEAFRWMVEARGFDHARIERWTVAREMGAPGLLDSDIPGADSMNVLLSKLSMAPDYSIIARRGSM